MTVIIIILYIYRTWASIRGYLSNSQCIKYIYRVYYLCSSCVFCRSKIRVAVTKRTRRSVKSLARNFWPTRRPSTDTRPTRKSSTCARPTDGTRVPPLPPPHRSNCIAGVPEIRLPDDRHQTDTNVSPVQTTIPMTL